MLSCRQAFMLRRERHHRKRGAASLAIPVAKSSSTPLRRMDVRACCYLHHACGNGVCYPRRTKGGHEPQVGVRAPGAGSSFAYAWDAAMRASREPALTSSKEPALNLSKEPALSLSKEPALSLSKGDEVDEVKAPPVPPRYGNTSPSRSRRERAFSGFVAALRDWNPERTSASALNP